MDRYFIGKFKKKQTEIADLTEVNGSFVLYALGDTGELTAVYSNTDVRKGDIWDYCEEQQSRASKYKARKKKK